MLILGIGGWLHDGSAALVLDGKCVAAIEEEKLLRQRHPGGFPDRAVTTCLKIAGARRKDIDIVALSKPLAAGKEASALLHLKTLFPNSKTVVVDHHTAHAAAAFFPSPFENSQVLTLDHHGDVCCGATWQGAGNQLQAIDASYYPDSPAALYSKVTELLGFQPDSEEHKVQWLSVTGEPRFKEMFLAILGMDRNSLPKLDHSYLDTGRTTQGGFSERFYRELDINFDELPGEGIKADVAASIQTAVAETVVRIAGEGKNLCLGGGLAYNALLIQGIEEAGHFENVWVQPVTGNAGTSLGSALFALHQSQPDAARHVLRNLFLGETYGSEEIKRVLENCKLRFGYHQSEGEMVKAAVQQLTDNKIVAWFQGRTEFGPRALGNRSILASPRNPYATQNLNEYIKHREPFRKFAASVPEELASEYFEVSDNARFLATVSRVKSSHRETFSPALLDADRIRVHVVCREKNRLYWELLQAVGNASGLPVVYNTSFNLFGEPLVSDPRSAVRSFYSSGIDALFIERFFVEKGSRLERTSTV